MDGKIKTINSKGYGFIETSKHIDYFFHHSAFLGEWKALLSLFVKEEPIYVEFENDLTAKDGPRAINVKVKESI